MFLRVVVSVLPPRKAVVVLEAASPTSHKRPPLPSVAVADLLAKIIMLLKIYVCAVCLWPMDSRASLVLRKSPEEIHYNTELSTPQLPMPSLFYCKIL